MSSGRVGHTFSQPGQEIGGGFSHDRLRSAQESMG